MLKFFNKRLHNRKGFTLIELIIVIAILAILAVIAIPRLGGFTEQARQANDKEAAALAANASAMYYAQHLSDTTPPANGAACLTGAINSQLITTADLTMKSNGYGKDTIIGTDGGHTITLNADGTITVLINGDGTIAQDYSITK